MMGIGNKELNDINRISSYIRLCIQIATTDLNSVRTNAKEFVQDQLSKSLKLADEMSVNWGEDFDPDLDGAIYVHKLQEDAIAFLRVNAIRLDYHLSEPNRMIEQWPRRIIQDIDFIKEKARELKNTVKKAYYNVPGDELKEAISIVTTEIDRHNSDHFPGDSKLYFYLKLALELLSLINEILIFKLTDNKAVMYNYNRDIVLSEKGSSKYKVKVFISYSHDDKEFAIELERALHVNNVNVWIDSKEILAGDSLIQRISEGINASRYICAVLSSNSVNSKWVKQELDIAMNYQIEQETVTVLPLVIEKGIELPVFLQGKRYIDFSSSSLFEAGIDEILRRIIKDM